MLSFSYVALGSPIHFSEVNEAVQKHDCPINLSSFEFVHFYSSLALIQLLSTIADSLRTRDGNHKESSGSDSVYDSINNSINASRIIVPYSIWF